MYLEQISAVIALVIGCTTVKSTLANVEQDAGKIIGKKITLFGLDDVTVKSAIVYNGQIEISVWGKAHNILTSILGLLKPKSGGNEYEFVKDTFHMADNGVKVASSEPHFEAMETKTLKGINEALAAQNPPAGFHPNLAALQFFNSGCNFFNIDHKPKVCHRGKQMRLFPGRTRYSLDPYDVALSHGDEALQKVGNSLRSSKELEVGGKKWTVAGVTIVEATGNGGGNGKLLILAKLADAGKHYSTLIKAEKNKSSGAIVASALFAVDGKVPQPAITGDFANTQKITEKLIALNK